MSILKLTWKIKRLRITLLPTPSENILRICRREFALSDIIKQFSIDLETDLQVSETEQHVSETEQSTRKQTVDFMKELDI